MKKSFLFSYCFILFLLSVFSQINKNDSLILYRESAKGIEYYQKGELDSAIIQFEKVANKVQNLKIKYPENNYLDEVVVNSLDYLSSIYYNQGKLQEAIAKAVQVLKFYENKNDSLNIALSLNNIAYMYQSQNMVDKAFEFYNKSLLILSVNNDKEAKIYLATVNNNLGLIYERSNLDSSLIFYQKALKIRNEIGDKRGISESLNNIGNALRKMNKIDEALDYLLQSLTLKEEIQDVSGIGYTQNNISIIYFLKGDYNKSEYYAKKSYNSALKIGSIEGLSQISFSLSKLYYTKKNYKDAHHFLKQYMLYKDSVININNKKAIYKQQIQYEFDKKEALITAEHEKQLAVEKEAKAKQKVILFAIAGGLGLVAVFSLFIYNRLQITRKQKLVIENQKKVVEKAHHELEEKNKEITDSIQYAKRIQNAILPPAKVVKEYLQESFILYKPKDIVAGDFYWLEQKNGKVLFAAADCTGHGVPGAMVSVICNNGLNRSVREHGLTTPGEILDKTREIVIQEFEKSEDEVKDGMDISLCSLSDNKLEWAGANNPIWIIRKGADDIEEIKADKQPIGKYDSPKPYTTHNVELQKGDSFYIFSDGYVDQFGGEQGKKFKSANFKKLLLSIKNEPLEKQKDLIDEAFANWKGNIEQVDDVCVIGVRI